MPLAKGLSSNGHLLILGRIPRFVTPKSEFKLNPEWQAFLRKSKNEIPALTHQPAIINREVEEKRITDYGKVDPISPVINEQALELAVDWCYEHFTSIHNSPTLLDEHFPNSTDKYIVASELAYNSIKYLMTTSTSSKRKSPGFPWNSPQNPLGVSFSTKMEVVEYPGFYDYLRDFLFQALNDRPYYTYMAECLKDEIVTNEKAEGQRTRVFMSASIEHFLMSLALFGPMHERFIAGHASTFSTAGFDYHRGRWHTKIGKLPYELLLSADFKNYDVYLRSVMFYALYLLLKRVFEDRWELIEPMVRSILQQACYSLFVDSQGNVYLKQTGNPSGQFLTLFFNTLMLYVFNALFYIMKVHKTQPNQFPLERVVFEALVRFMFCGDDQLHNISPAIAPYWNPNALMQFWTNELKMVIKEFKVSTDICDGIEYCGKTTKKQDGMYLPVPRIEKFMSSMCWSTTDDPRIELLRMRSLYEELYSRPDLQKLLMGYVDYYYTEVTAGTYTDDPIYGRSTFPTRKKQKEHWLGI